MTAEEMAALIEALTPKLSEITNAAITSHTKRIQKDFDAKLAEFKVETPAPITEAPAKEGKGKSSPEQAALETKLADALKRIEEAETRRQAAEDRARDNSAFGKLKELLGKSGVRPDMVDIAAERLFHIQKRVSYDENTGEPLFKIKKAPAPGMSEEDVELTFDSGVEHWLKSKDASPFVAAPAAGGPGGRGGKSPLGVPSGRSPNGMPKYDAPASTDEEKVARAAEAERALQKAMENAGF